MIKHDPATSALPLTSYAVLGLLTQGEASGYDLIKRAQQCIAYFFWSPSRSQIYAELGRLEGGGYVTERAVEQERRPDKRVYAITPTGEATLHAWLIDPQTTASQTILLLKIFLGKLITPEQLITQIRRTQGQAQATLAEYQQLEAEHPSKVDDFFPYLTLLSGLAHTRATIEWADRVIAELEQTKE